MKMVLHSIRRQDDALSCLTSRCIYSIDSFKSILWILWLLLFSLHFHQSVINLGECLPYIIVIWYFVRLLWKSVSCRHKGRKLFSRLSRYKKLVSGRPFLALFVKSVYNLTDWRQGMRRKDCTYAMGESIFKEEVFLCTVVFENVYI